jgi:hypothetical protein
MTIRLNNDGYTIENITLCVAEKDQAIRPTLRRFEGELIDYFETGTEGVIWMLEDDRRVGREALEPICEGDDCRFGSTWDGSLAGGGPLRQGNWPAPLSTESGVQPTVCARALGTLDTKGL